MTDFEQVYAETRGIIQEWVDKQGHERCWYYPELFRRLAEVYQITQTVEPLLPPKNEFKRGCERYQQEEYEGKDESSRM